MMVQMNVERVLQTLQRTDIQVVHLSLSDVGIWSAQRNSVLFVVGTDIAPALSQVPKMVVMKELINYDELEDKLSRALSCEKDSFRIE